MLLNKNKIFYSLCLLLSVYCHPLRTPIFENPNGVSRILLPFEDGLQIVRYEIMEGKMGADPNSFTPINSNHNLKFRGSILIIDIDFINKDSGRQYSICVTTRDDKTFFSESFVYDKKVGNYVLERLYDRPPFYVRYAPHIGIGLVVCGALGGILFFISRRRPKNDIEENL
jgi:hypothetical protein